LQRELSETKFLTTIITTNHNHKFDNTNYRRTTELPTMMGGDRAGESLRAMKIAVRGAVTKGLQCQGSAEVIAEECEGNEDQGQG
jgi:hypothetical protein